jgi:hypothetical protein
VIDSTEMRGIYRGFYEYMISREFVWVRLCMSSHWLENGWYRSVCCFASCESFGKDDSEFSE